jgi:hypothetical protein
MQVETAGKIPFPYWKSGQERLLARIISKKGVFKKTAVV